MVTGIGRHAATGEALMRRSTAHGTTRHPAGLSCVMRIGARVGAAVVFGLIALQLTGCGSTIKPDGAAQSVADLVSGQTQFHLNASDVTCPSGVDAKAGVEFDCHFTGPEGPYTAHLRVTKVAGDNVEFDIKTQQS